MIKYNNLRSMTKHFFIGAKKSTSIDNDWHIFYPLSSIVGFLSVKWSCIIDSEMLIMKNVSWLLKHQISFNENNFWNYNFALDGCNPNLEIQIQVTREISICKRLEYRLAVSKHWVYAIPIFMKFWNCHFKPI